MIVEDKGKVIDVADELVFEMFDVIMKKLPIYKGDDCGAEIIYLLTHTCAIFTSKMKMLLSTYASMFGVEEVPFDKWMAVIVPEYDNRLKESVAKENGVH